MFPFQSCHGYDRWSMPAVNSMNGGDSVLNSMAKSTEAACKSHKEAERRRRQRINAHLSTLRALLPNTTKTDKASLLAEVVKHVKELERQFADVVRESGDVSPFPGESDSVTVSQCCDGEAGKKLLKVTLCCEDRHGLNRDLSRVIKSVRARVVRAEMMTVGPRSKVVVVIQWAAGEEVEGLKRALKDVVENRVIQWAGAGGGEEVEGLKRALKDVVENRASGSGLGLVGVGFKRSRVYGSIHEGDAVA
ncbi:HLH domain-containing protein [Cephalotus follicularis]|uniref:HLH domain-containing protein n=1 Tax=Cephalotus follicularis TaxID=3775 RepID=A0A1Q3BFW4_CEPFO|nr:HLH domain-containing protein [Cephalotus follicularis]